MDRLICSGLVGVGVILATSIGIAVGSSGRSWTRILDLVLLLLQFPSVFDWAISRAVIVFVVYR